MRCADAQQCCSLTVMYQICKADFEPLNQAVPSQLVSFSSTGKEFKGPGLNGTCAASMTSRSTIMRHTGLQVNKATAKESVVLNATPD